VAEAIARRDNPASRSEERRRQRWAARKLARAEAVDAAWLAAEEGTKGNMLNRRGLEAGVNERTLFTGPESRARKYASEELLNWWETHPRPTEAYFEGRDTRMGYGTVRVRSRMTTEEAGVARPVRPRHRVGTRDDRGVNRRRGLHGGRRQWMILWPGKVKRPRSGGLSGAGSDLGVTDMDRVSGQCVIALQDDEVITSTGAVVPAPRVSSGGELLDRVSAKFGDDGLVLLGEGNWDHLTENPGGGWQIHGSGAWRAAENDGRYVRLGIVAAVKPGNDPMIADNLVTTTMLHGMWHSLTGVPFYIDGGVTSSLLMDATISCRGGQVLRKWRDPNAPRLPELPWFGSWGLDMAGLDGCVTMDRNGLYLSAAGMTYLPADAPEPDGKGEVVFAEITIPENPEPRLPHPCGAASNPGSRAWVTAPTLDLLAQEGAAPEVHQVWNSPRMRRLLGGPGKWYERLRDARSELLAGAAVDPDIGRVLQAVKDCYSRGVGAALMRDTGRWYRPDWTALIKAQARTSTWRALRRIGDEEGLWPVAMHTDTATWERMPATLRIGTGMGQWKRA
jgi:hypothetical protein